jgi:hypothetical protein
MADVISLRRARKRKARALQESEASANRVRYGVSKVARHASEAERERQIRGTDAKKLDPRD